MEEWTLIDPIELSNELKEFFPITLFQNNSPSSIPWQNNLILVDYQYFLEDLYQSFHYDFQNIIRLFYLDVPRENLIINNIPYSDPKKAYQTISNLSLNEKTKHFIYMLSTQCSMVLPCQILTEAYCSDNSLIPKYLAETREGSSMKVNIEVNKEDGYINVSKIMRIFHLKENGEDLTNCFITINIYLNITEEKYIILTLDINQI